MFEVGIIKNIRADGQTVLACIWGDNYATTLCFIESKYVHQIHFFVGQTGHYAFCLGPAGVSYTGTQFCKFILGHGSCSSMSGNNIPA